jgi:endonuclease YncB( thermonuclease family)
MVLRRSQPRPLLRTLVDALVFLSTVFIVVLVMNSFNVFNIGSVSFGTGEYAIIDGDSLRKGATEILLVGIDAPEYRQTCTDSHGISYECGKEAASALRFLVGSGAVNCESHDIDRYHRALSTCRVNNLNINQELVRLGWAVTYSLRGDAFDYMIDESEARHMKRGMWQGEFETPSDYRKRQRTMQGSVANITEPDD